MKLIFSCHVHAYYLETMLISLAGLEFAFFFFFNVSGLSPKNPHSLVEYTLLGAAYTYIYVLHTRIHMRAMVFTTLLWYLSGRVCYFSGACVTIKPQNHRSVVAIRRPRDDVSWRFGPYSFTRIANRLAALGLLQAMEIPIFFPSPLRALGCK